MRHKNYFLFFLGGVIGVAACNPDSAGAQMSQPLPLPLPATDTSQVSEPAKLKRTHIIEIHKMAFQTIAQAIRIGDSITWLNRDIVPHTATARDKSWDSGMLRTGESFTLSINSQTMLDYFCLYHRQMQAKLTLAVQE